MFMKPLVLVSLLAVAIGASGHTNRMRAAERDQTACQPQLDRTNRPTHGWTNTGPGSLGVSAPVAGNPHGSLILAMSGGLALSGCTAMDGAATTATQELTGETDQVLAWNITALRVIPLLQGALGRPEAILHVSIADAVTGVNGDYEPLIVNQTAPSGSTENAAAAGAAYYTLSHLPYNPPLTAAQQQIITDAYNELPTSITGNPGFAFGEDVAAQVMANRADDGAPSVDFSLYHAPCEGLPGCWVPQPTPTGPALSLLPTWGNQRTWVLTTATQFLPEPPRALDSETYLRDVAEVQEIGYRFSTTRTATQTNIATWWNTSSFLLWNPIARRLSVARNLSVSENARLFALMSVAAADAYINTWNTKFHYNFWRPITAIQYTGNTTWLPLLPTPPFPEFTSAHASASAAFVEALVDAFGDNPGIPILATSPSAPNFDHYWVTFSEALDEVIDARVYSGIHFRNSDVVAVRFGSHVGDYVLKHAYRTQFGHRPAHGAHGNAPAEVPRESQDPNANGDFVD